MFSDFKTRGFGLEDTRLRSAERVDHLVLIMTLAMYWCVQTGHRDACELPTPLEKNRRAARSRTLELPQARPLLPLVVPARAAELAELGRPLPHFGLPAPPPLCPSR